MLYEFELGLNATETTKDICFAKDESEVDQSAVTKWFKKICLGWKSFNDRARSGRPEAMHSTVMLQAIETIPVGDISPLNDEPLKLVD